MRITEIAKMPTTCEVVGRTHESVMRSYHIVDKVVELLELGTPVPVVLEIIEDMRQIPQSETELVDTAS